MKNDNHTEQRLDQLFAIAKQQEPLAKNKNVHDLINNASAKALPGKHLVKHVKFNLKTILMSTIVSSIIIGSVVWVNFHTKTNNTAPENNFEQTQISSAISATKVEVNNRTSKKSNVLLRQKADTIFLNITKDAEKKDEALLKDTSIRVSPKQITIDTNQPVKLSLSDFSKIGFYFTDTSACFINLTEDSIWSFYSGAYYKRGDREGYGHTYYTPIREMITKKKVSEYDYFPWGYSEDIQLRTVSFIFESMKKNWKATTLGDSLIPIALDTVNIGYDGVKKRHLIMLSHKVFWFNLTPALYTLLPDTSKELALAHYRKGQTKGRFYKTKTVNENAIEQSPKYPDIITSLSKAVELSKKDLSKFGFEIENDSVNYKFRFSVKDTTECYISLHYVYDGSCGVRFNDRSELENEVLKKFNANVIPEIVSNSKGFQNIKWGQRIETKQNNIIVSQEIGGIYHTLTDYANYLIPVKVKIRARQPESKDLYFWFKPTEEFFKALPKTISDEIRSDYNILNLKSDTTVSDKLKSQLTTSCKYFDECRYNLPVLKSILVYPNPATDNVTVEMRLEKQTEITVLLYDMSGRMIKALKQRENYSQGPHQFELSLTGIASGIYTLVLRDKDGNLKTQRIIKQ